MKTLNSARLHCHSGRVALTFPGLSSVYLSPLLALKLADSLLLAIAQMENDDHFSTIEIKA